MHPTPRRRCDRHAPNEPELRHVVVIDPAAAAAASLEQLRARSAVQTSGRPWEWKQVGLDPVFSGCLGGEGG
jgi:hypothetical protein